ncbi:hypothetical protein IQ235_15175 [Oscillatoriales cyanobacterium LEGE 11467]|uniref:Uncharacterized protein n=1 Tax=Zarconia navalis LEGE 11467 TaxID=1828826 RepID=A0A928W198_9CYAN|nr:hypothetical protein [Zarconia navalis]MBE9042121.1 hypothetical protein [Zarconia navalis LEGE 11467]
MLKKQKINNLQTLIFKGHCPFCSSTQIKYREYQKNKIFDFKCYSCNTKEKYTLEEVIQASKSWNNSTERQA